MKKIEVTMQREELTMKADVEQFAMALKTWRLRAGKTQDEVGKMFGLSRYTIMRLESAKAVSWETAYRAFAKLSEQLAIENNGER